MQNFDERPKLTTKVIHCSGSNPRPPEPVEERRVRPKIYQNIVAASNYHDIYELNEKYKNEIYLTPRGIEHIASFFDTAKEYDKKYHEELIYSPMSERRDSFKDRINNLKVLISAYESSNARYRVFLINPMEYIRKEITEILTDSNNVKYFKSDSEEVVRDSKKTICSYDGESDIVPYYQYMSVFHDFGFREIAEKRKYIESVYGKYGMTVAITPKFRYVNKMTFIESFNIEIYCVGKKPFVHKVVQTTYPDDEVDYYTTSKRFWYSSRFTKSSLRSEQMDDEFEREIIQALIRMEY